MHCNGLKMFCQGSTQVAGLTEEILITFIRLKVKENKYVYCRGNGAVEYDEEQGYYLPLGEEGISEKDILQLKNRIVDFVNEGLVDLKEAAGTENYAEVTDGGNPVIQKNLYCAECGEECDRCGAMFNAETEGCMDDRWNLCDCCKERYDEEQIIVRKQQNMSVEGYVENFI